MKGLAAMPPQRPLGQGHLLRPLLDVSRVELEAYARQQGLSWIEDPSNDDHRYARNYLRQRVFPVLAEQWPQASTTLARSAAHMGEAQTLLDDLARIDLAQAATPGVFDWLGLQSLALAPLRGLVAGPSAQRFEPLAGTDDPAARYRSLVGLGLVARCRRRCPTDLAPGRWRAAPGRRAGLVVIRPLAMFAARHRRLGRSGGCAAAAGQWSRWCSTARRLRGRSACAIVRAAR